MGRKKKATTTPALTKTITQQITLLGILLTPKK